MLFFLAFAAGSAAYSGFNNLPPSKKATCPSPLFSAATLTPHDTGLAPTHLDVAAKPRASPKPKGPFELGTGESVPDPMGLWATKGPDGPRPPSVFKLNQGRAIDTIRRDYPRLLTEKPDLSIFTQKVELHDSMGKRIVGIKRYERLFDTMRFVRSTMMQDAEISYRLVVVDDLIRVRWNAKLWMRDPALGLTTLVNGEPALAHLDGVSVYHLDADGKIDRHTLEKLQLRGQGEPLANAVPIGFAWPNAAPELAMPSPFFQPLDRSFDALPEGLARLLRSTADALGGDATSSSTDATTDTAAGSKGVAGGAFQSQRRASSASKRAPPPRASAANAGETPMQRAAREREEDAEKERRLQELRTAKAEEPDALSKLLGVSMPQQCETSFDCEEPEVCCDLLFARVCCAGGMLIPSVSPEQSLQRQRQAIPIPVERDGPFVPPGAGNLPPRGNDPF